MVVKEKRGRRRYIAFEVLSDTPLNLAELKSILRNEAQHYGMEPPKVIQFENQRGIVRCPHTEKEKIVELLNNIKRTGKKELRIRSLRTSGTLRKLRRLYFQQFSK